MEVKLNGKVAVVTGGGGVLCGIMAKSLAKAGAKVAILDLRAEAAEAVAEDARTNPAPEFFPPDLICRDIKELGELLLASRN